MAKPMPRSRAIRVLGVALIYEHAVPDPPTAVGSRPYLIEQGRRHPVTGQRGCASRQEVGPLQVPRAARQPPAGPRRRSATSFDLRFRAVQVHLPPWRGALCAQAMPEALRPGILCKRGEFCANPAQGLLQGGRREMHRRLLCAQRGVCPVDQTGDRALRPPLPSGPRALRQGHAARRTGAAQTPPPASASAAGRTRRSAIASAATSGRLAVAAKPAAARRAASAAMPAKAWCAARLATSAGSRSYEGTSASCGEHGRSAVRPTGSVRVPTSAVRRDRWRSTAPVSGHRPPASAHSAVRPVRSVDRARARSASISNPTHKTAEAAATCAKAGRAAGGSAPCRDRVHVAYPAKPTARLSAL